MPSKSDRIGELRKRLRQISPQHDTPLGLIHPYWARKPMNVLEAIIDCLSEPMDLIADPFMGSGTTIFAALARGRRAVGSDINALSCFIVNSALAIAHDPQATLWQAQQFIARVRQIILPWYKLEEAEWFIERERFKVKGEFAHGRFKLEPTEIVAKRWIGMHWEGRKIIRNPKKHNSVRFYRNYLRSPLDFSKIKLIANSRIAIPQGARLSHFFTKRNTAAINFVIQTIAAENATDKTKNVYRFLLSAALPLLRLSDKKASNQWPYWRPKDNLTSRNAVIMLDKRLDSLRELVEWLGRNPLTFQLVPANQLQRHSTHSPTVHVFCAPIQSLASRLPKHLKVDLVLTDPPYADQAPYLEYSALWNSLLELGIQEEHFRLEIVKSDSAERSFDSLDYASRLSSAFDQCCKILKPDGYLVWFYQDHELAHWKAIWTAAVRNKMRLADVLSMPKQRRSMKTVTSPGATLDGDLICIFQRNTSEVAARSMMFEKVKKSISRHLRSLDNKPLFDQYAFLMKYCLQKGLIAQLSDKAKTVRAALNLLREP